MSEKTTAGSLDYLSDPHCSVTKVSRLDSLDGNNSFLEHKESILERPIPLEKVNESIKEVELLADPLENMDAEVNNWQAYFVQFD